MALKPYDIYRSQSIRPMKTDESRILISIGAQMMAIRGQKEMLGSKCALRIKNQY